MNMNKFIGLNSFLLSDNLLRSFSKTCSPTFCILVLTKHIIATIAVEAQVLGAATLHLVEDTHSHFLQHFPLILYFIDHLALLVLVSLISSIIGRLIILLSFFLFLTNFNRSIASGSLGLTLGRYQRA